MSATPPLFAQIEAALRQRIVRCELAPGDKLPSEAQLEIEFGVSRITVRQALAALRSSGLIEKVNGKGSFVTRPADAPDLGPLRGFYDHMRALGRRTHGTTLSVREVPAPEAAAQALRIEVGTPVTAVTILRLVDDKPLAVGTTWGAHVLMTALVAEDIETNDMMTLLETRLGYRLRSMHTEASAIPAGKLRARQLGVAPEAPLLRMRFTPHDISDRPLCYTDMCYRGDGFSYQAVVKRFPHWPEGQ